MKKLIVALLTLMLMIPAFAFAENSAELDRNHQPEDFAGMWTLAAAYIKDTGDIEVTPDAITLEITLKIDKDVLVDVAKYIHADVTNLRGTLSFHIDGEDAEDCRCAAAWDQFGDGASRFKVRDDDDTELFFSKLTGVEIEDFETPNTVGFNANGQLILGYSDEHIESDPTAEFEYAYIFNKVEQ